MKRFAEPTSTIRDGFLALAFDVYRNEERFWGYHALEEGKNERCWSPVQTEIFPMPISLGNVLLARTVQGPSSVEKVTFVIDDELVTVGANFDPELYEDEWSRETLRRAQDSFYGHVHKLCFRARREQIQAANDKLAGELTVSDVLLSKTNHSMTATFEASA